MAADLRSLSSVLFGHRYRLELLGALAGAGEAGVCPTVLAAQQGVPASVFYPSLQELQRVGLVVKSGPGADRRVAYSATDDPVWTGLRGLVQDLGMSSSAIATGSGSTR